jgi:hypothetical protein
MGLMSTVLFVLAMLIGMAAHDRLLPALTVKQIN